MTDDGIMVVVKGFHNMGSLQKISPDHEGDHGLFSTSGWAIREDRLPFLKEVAIVRNGPADASFYVGRIEKIIPINALDGRGCERYVIVSRYDPSLFVSKSLVPHANDIGYYDTSSAVYLY